VPLLWKTENILSSQSLIGLDAFTGRAVEVTFGGAITRVAPASPTAASTYLAPGFIDLQVNGFAGVDYGSPFTTDDLAHSIEAQFAKGVTRLLATVITGSAENMLAAIRNLARGKADLGAMGEAIAGLHIEGPHISPEDGPRGAHPRAHVRPPSLDEFHRWQEASGGLVKMVTLAPEWPGSLAYIDALVKQGVVLAIGHTAATAQQISEAISAGATLATHLGNATFPTPKKFNTLWDQLADDRLAASVIADGFHLPASFLKTALRTKSANRLVLVTDAAAPAGAAPGRYRLGEVDVELGTDGRVTLAGGTRLAGSALTLDRAISNAMHLAGATLAEAIAMATLNPARLGRIPSRQAGLAAGDVADLVEFTLANGAIHIRRVWLAGQQVFGALY